MKIKVWKNDNWETLSFKNEDQLPGIRNSCTIVPISTVLNALGFITVWGNGTLSIRQDNKIVKIYEKRSYFEMIETIDGESDHIRYDHTDKKEIDSPVVGGRLLTPIRDVLESLCYIVLWDDASKNVKIIPPAENKITVRFNYNYGIEKSSDKPYFERVSEGEAVTLPIPSRTGFVFDGWHIGRTDGTWVGDGKKSPTYYPAKSVTLYAYWGRKYNITLVTNGGTVATPILRVDIGVKSIQLPTPDREGYKFEGWFLNSDFQGEPVNAEDYHPIDHVTLYAKWKLNFPRIRYGSTTESDFENVDCGSIEGHTLGELILKQLDDRTDVTLAYAGKNVKEVLNESSSCVLYSFAMVLYALKAKVTKYDYRTGTVHEMDADPYTCLMANIDARGDWSEAEF